MRGSRSKGKGKGTRARDRARGRREEGTPANKLLFWPSRLLIKKKNNKNKATVND